MRCYYCNAMPFVPAIKDYKPFYFQTDSDASAWDTRDYGMIVQEQPFPDNYEAKEPYKNTWHDENGDDEYTDAMFRKAFEYTLKLFIQAGTIEEVNTLRDAFRAKIKSGSFKIWDSWQKRGFASVRFVSDKVENRRITDDFARMIFSLTIKVNDPSTVVSFSNGSIVTA